MTRMVIAIFVWAVFGSSVFGKPCVFRVSNVRALHAPITWIAEADATWKKDMAQVANVFLAKHELTSNDWGVFLKHTTAEIQEWLSDPKRLAIRVHAHAQGRRGMIGRFFLGDRVLFMPSHIPNKEALSLILGDITDIIRKQKYEHMRAELAMRWNPIRFVQHATWQQRWWQDLKIKTAYRNLEFAMVLSAMELPFPERFWLGDTHATVQLLHYGHRSVVDMRKMGQPFSDPVPSVWAGVGNPIAWGGYVKVHWLSWLFWGTMLATSDTSEEFSEWDGVDMEDGEFYLAAHIQKETSRLAKQQDITLTWEFPGRPPVTFWLGEGNSAGVSFALHPAAVIDFEEKVWLVISNRYADQTVFERYGYALHTRWLAFQLGLRLGLWVYFPPELTRIGITYTHFMFHRWTPDQLAEDVEALLSCPSYPIPHFLKGSAKVHFEHMIAGLRNNDPLTVAKYQKIMTIYREIAEREIFSTIREAMAEDEAQYQDSLRYHRITQLGKWVISALVASKAHAALRLARFGGFWRLSGGTATFLGTYGGTTYATDKLEQGDVTEMQQRSAFLYAWDAQYRKYTKTLSSIRSDSNVASFPLVQFLREDSVADVLEMAQLMATAQRLALIQDPNITKQVHACRTDPNRYWQQFQTERTDVHVEGQHSGFLERAFTYPTLCELWVLATAQPTRLSHVAIHAPLSSDVHPDSRMLVSAFGPRIPGQLEYWPRTGWPKHLDVAVLAAALWALVFDHTLKVHMLHFPTAAAFARACVLHTYIHHALQWFIMERMGEGGMGSWFSHLWDVWERDSADQAMRVTVNKKSLLVNSGVGIDIGLEEQDQAHYGSQVPPYWWHAMSPLPKSMTFSALYARYHQMYAAYYEQYRK